MTVYPGYSQITCCVCATPCSETSADKSPGPINHSTPQKRPPSWNGVWERAQQDQSRETWLLLSREVESRQLEACDRTVAALKEVQIAFTGTC